jgi:hypothetical protein
VGAADRWDFESNIAGRQIFVDFQKLEGGRLNFSLVAPGGAILLTSTAEDTNDAQGGPAILDALGTYSLLVFGQGDDTPTYEFKLWDVPASDVQPLELGAEVQGEVPTPGSSRTYRFSALPGQSVLVDVDEVGGAGQLLDFVLRDAQGQIVFSRRAGSGLAGLPDQGRVLLAAGGEYALTVSGVGDDVADFRLTVWDAPAVPGPIDEKTVASGRILSTTDTHEWTFTLNEPRTMSIESLGGSDGYRWQLISPSGVVLYDSTLPGAERQLQASEPGTYRLLISGDGTATADYHVRLSYAPSSVQVGASGAIRASADIFLGTTPQFSQATQQAVAEQAASTALASRSVALASGLALALETSTFDLALLTQGGHGAILALPQLFRVGGDASAGEKRSAGASVTQGRRRDVTEAVADVTLMSYLADADQVHLAGIESGDEPPSRESAKPVRVARSAMRPADDENTKAADTTEKSPAETGGLRWWLAIVPLSIASWYAVYWAKSVRRRRAIAREVAHQKLGAEWLPAPPPSRVENPRS